VAKAFVISFNLAEEILHILSFGGVILGTKAGYNGQLSSIGEVLHILLRCVEQGTDKTKLSIG
jgi:hypothetical protein